MARCFSLRSLKERLFAGFAKFPDLYSLPPSVQKEIWRDAMRAVWKYQPTRKRLIQVFLGSVFGGAILSAIVKAVAESQGWAIATSQPLATIFSGLFSGIFVIPPLLLWNYYIRMAILKSLKDRKAQICLHCGYDLRTAPEKCPECGHPR